MAFDVEWHESAMEELAAIWLRASDPERVTVACTRLEAELSESPLTIGRPIDVLKRSHIVVPLAIIFEVDVDKCRVIVTQLKEWSPEFN